MQNMQNMQNMQFNAKSAQICQNIQECANQNMQEICTNLQLEFRNMQFYTITCNHMQERVLSMRKYAG